MKMIVHVNPFATTILLLIATYIVNVQAWFTDVELTGVENSDAGILKTDFRVARINRTLYAISGNSEFTEDLENNFDCEMKMYKSSTGNTQYHLMPIGLPRTSCCEVFHSIYFRRLEKSVLHYTDFPERVEGSPYCHMLKKGTHTLKPYGFSKDMVIKVSEPGMYKAEFLIYSKATGSVSSACSFAGKLI